MCYGTTTPDTSYALYVNGDAAATSFVNISTRDQKHDIEYLDDTDKRSITDKIRNIKVAEYRYNGEKGSAPLRLGLIAEEAPEEILSANKKGVDVYKLATFILAGVQEQQKRLEGLEVRMTNLETLIGSTTPQTGGISLASVLSGFEALGTKITDGVASFRNLVVESLTVGKSTQPTAITVYDKNGKAGCMTIEDVDAGTTKITAGACGSTNTTTPASTPSTNSEPQTTNSSDTTPPVITINGNNPAEVTKGSSYADLGASVTDNVSTNLGAHYFVNGLSVLDISLDTSTTTTYTIDYVATDGAGNTATSTRTVIVSDSTSSTGSEQAGSPQAEPVVEPLVPEPEPETPPADENPPTDSGQAASSTPSETPSEPNP